MVHGHLIYTFYIIFLRNHSFIWHVTLGPCSELHIMSLTKLWWMETAMVQYDITGWFLRMIMYIPCFELMKVKKDQSTHIFVQIEL